MTRAALVPALAVAGAVATCGGVAAAATSWIVVLHTNSAGEGHAQALPSTPAGVTASCAAATTSKTIKVTWDAVTHATSYSVYDSTTSSSGTYSLVTSVTTTSWTSGTLSTGNYWYEVTASVGTNWASAKSSASGESTIDAFDPYCVQP